MEIKVYDVIVAFDNGHGENTPGKRSPDGKLREYKWTREIVDMIIAELTKKGVKTYKVVPENTDIPLSQRVARVNKLYTDNNKKVILISVHINAASNGQWSNASGWSGWIAKNASVNSKRLAQLLYAEAEKAGLKGNRAVPKEKYWEAGFYICKNTKCPTVLTENLFQDNKKEVEYLLSDEGKKTIVDIHVNAILKYLNG